MKKFILKVLTLVIVSLIGSMYFVSYVYNPKQGSIGVLYYSLMMFPTIFLSMSVGLPISYLVEYIKKRYKKTSLLFISMSYFIICLFFIYIPFTIIQKQFSIHAIIYFLLLPVLFSIIEFLLTKFLVKKHEI